MKKKIIKKKYVGESAHSLFDTGFEHQQAMNQLRLVSHMLKHALEKHEDEYMDVKFGNRAIAYSGTAFERQITEACKIQEERVHYKILNSRAQHSRSVVRCQGMKRKLNEFKSRKSTLKNKEKREIVKRKKKKSKSKK